mmetsp:Transcript_11039/g.20299  ORF Transcript_11039/g.20299 Transcript_11039/m.20299 type:complete len:392 (+) Transcript_11039:124-1299(+)
MPFAEPIRKRANRGGVKGGSEGVVAGVAKDVPDGNNRTLTWLICLSVVSGLFGVLELLAVTESLSLALIADGMHTLLDCLCYVVNLVAEVKVQKDLAKQPGPEQLKEEQTRLLIDEEICCQITEDDLQTDLCNWGVLDLINGKDCKIGGSPKTKYNCPCHDTECGTENSAMEASAVVLSPVSNTWIFGGTLFTGIVMLGASTWVTIDACLKLSSVYNGDAEETSLDRDARVTLIIVSVVGFTLRFGLLLASLWLPQLHSYHHMPGQRCSHKHNIHLFASLLHLIADQLESVVLVIVAILIYLGFNSTLVDGIGSLVIATIVIYLSLRLMAHLYKTTYAGSKSGSGAASASASGPGVGAAQGRENPTLGGAQSEAEELQLRGRSMCCTHSYS